ncbi:hypothetical protein CUW_1005 [Turicibacter sanguinis PC909]|uniref:Lipoprotein n=1 Tax=Turicibacter sanguinis PC909 TaxID=702450 RepID=A0ABP2HYL4_9FIRM|nr:hypothetical protein CUW_1005 [Turicibacter sanguinis PC909]
MKLTKYILLILGFILISECEVLAHHLSFDSQRFYGYTDYHFME